MLIEIPLDSRWKPDVLVATYGYGKLKRAPATAPVLAESGLALGGWNVDKLLKDKYNPDYLKQVKDVFDTHSRRKKFPIKGDGFYEAPGVKEVEAHRVTGQILYDKLVGPKPEHWFHKFYLTDLLELTRFLMDDHDIYPFLGKPDDAYQGNAQYEPDERFPIHTDTLRTVSAWVNFSRIHPGNGGQLILSFGEETRGQEQLHVNSGKLIFPDTPGSLAVFDGSLIHGSDPLTDSSEPRRIIACSYWRPGFKERSEEFKQTRRSNA